MLKNNVSINIIIHDREHKGGIITSLTGIENLTSVHPEMVDFGFRQGPSKFLTAPKASRDLRQA